MGRDGEGGKKEVKGWKGGKDLPDQCQTASYAPVMYFLLYLVCGISSPFRTSDYVFCVFVFVVDVSNGTTS